MENQESCPDNPMLDSNHVHYRIEQQDNLSLNRCHFRRI